MKMTISDSNLFISYEEEEDKCVSYEEEEDT
jgi:hypothetical protein